MYGGSLRSLTAKMKHDSCGTTSTAFFHSPYLHLSMSEHLHYIPISELPPKNSSARQNYSLCGLKRGERTGRRLAEKQRIVILYQKCLADFET
jgi:hypothetical protein